MRGTKTTKALPIQWHNGVHSIAYNNHIEIVTKFILRNRHHGL